MIYITKIFHFEAAHVLRNYDGLCSNIHGHSYELQVTVKGEPINDSKNSKNGMVMDFRDLKKIVNEEIINIYDHAFIINETTPDDFIEETKRHFGKVIIVPFQPTSELLLINFAKKIKNRLPGSVKLAKLLLKETDSSFAEWYDE